MTNINFMEMVDLSFSEEYRRYVKHNCIDVEYDDSYLDMLVNELVGFDEFLDSQNYKLKV